ncbi:NAD(P)-dependent dehydrogenase (short-subunit alcohol dehydrogenase family) [Sphingomonas kaistensis]|uniref:NAD(P)-dependent dehydrogenase (Short-subunit alcohol dehydrogenase family) n=1 Tax=Sphingomonas kaistensis TaxID=298708 RepID=A0A7X5Y8E4_9SPHN|nr:SDR family oxidoreductase [Sphingomonas kaistensis]NJC06708.1 NAD(P)-dependent dehydrogenase (short-subunit alcohol dehydrogenase family) [Sphingomonas kaistensis]
MSNVAIITGAGRRVGRILAEGLLAEGWQVVTHVRNAEDEVPVGAIRVAADLAQGKAAAEAVLAACPAPPTLLVNNAARFAADSFADFSPEELGAHMAVNVAAPALLTAGFAAAGGEGDRLVVNILDAKLAAPNPDFLSYTLSKAALAALTTLSAQALGADGIRVNAIAPALMLLSEGQSAANFEATHRFNPLNRGVEPADVLRALRFLVDSPTLTGETLTLDGGQRFWRLPRDVQFLEPNSR